MAAIKVDANNFQNEVLESDKTVLVDFWAAWCGPCRMVSPIVDEIADENPEIKVAKVDVDANPELAVAYKIMTIPTLVVFKNGEITERVSGVKSKSEILGML